MNSPPLVVILAVGLTRRLLAHGPRLRALAEQGGVSTFVEPLPAVTCTAQATLLTGQPPSGHGVVANGWLFRDLREARFWQQSNALVQAEPFYATARRLARSQGRQFRAAKLFWWFNQGAAVDISLTPKPFYGADGNKAFAVDGTPRPLVDELETRLGKFPFPSFWGPRAGRACTDWIAGSAAAILADDPQGPPDLTLVYLPHLDYEPQRKGPSACDMAGLVAELDAACGRILEAARRVGARVWVVSEYGHCDVTRPVYLNRLLRENGLLTTRPGPFGEVLDTFGSRALAVCDHQLAHVYVADPADETRVAELLSAAPGVARVFRGEERSEIGLEHARSGELIALARPDSWFAYPFWLDDRLAPDYARTVDIHRKPGFDPCELFVDPAIRWPMLRVGRRLLRKKLGFRTLFDIVPLDARIVRGSHGLQAERDEDRPLWIHDQSGTAPGLPMTAFRDQALVALGFEP